MKTAEILMRVEALMYDVSKYCDTVENCSMCKLCESKRRCVKTHLVDSYAAMLNNGIKKEESEMYDIVKAAPDLLDALKHATHVCCVTLCASCLPNGAETGLATFVQNGCPRGSEGCDMAKWWEIIRKVVGII